MGDLILGIETSCDETAVAVVERATVVRSSVVSSQVELHAPFGGVVPEIAGRAHIRELVPVLADALAEAGVSGSDIEAVAATTGPGLAGSLLVGVSAAKALSLVWDVPFVAVNHLEAHLYASFLEEPDLDLPLVVLLVSGGHTMLVLMEDHGRYRLLGSTLDDAAGEAFDKVAALLGLPYPGGPSLARAAEEGDEHAVDFPRPLLGSPGLDFSYSGLKTAVAVEVERRGRLTPREVADIAASFQAAAVDVLVARARRALGDQGLLQLAVVGGVAANQRLRGALEQAGREEGFRVSFPPLALCTDNAAMIAAAGLRELSRGRRDGLDLNAFSRAPLQGGAVAGGS